MNNKILNIVLITYVILCSFSLSAQKKTPQDYISKWKQEAIRQMKLHQIPASITLAQGLLESGNGNSDLAVEANNHFGIKCHSTWTGGKFYKDDDKKDECFRKYKSANESYADHSSFLKRKRYEALFKLKITDYKGWAKGLKKAGYATNPKYPSLLINIIERYNLNKYDKEDYTVTTPKTETDSKPKQNETSSSSKDSITIKIGDYSKKYPSHSIKKTANKVPYIIILKGDNYENLEKEFSIRKRQVTKYNDLPKTHVLREGERIFLKPKRCKPKEEFHRVKEGESMRDISQLYGVKLKKLYKRNNLDVGALPKKGQKLNLRKRKKE